MFQVSRGAAADAMFVDQSDAADPGLRRRRRFRLYRRWSRRRAIKPILDSRISRFNASRSRDELDRPNPRSRNAKVIDRASESS
jgi:hypothetical protein